jgi:serine/threonine-protein kinase RsbW
MSPHDHKAPPFCEFRSRDLRVKIDVRLHADLNAISHVVEEIMHLARQMKCTEGKEFEIETALREALSNAIIHGCRNDVTKTVECCVGCDPDCGLLIVVRDPGDGFDPASIPSPIVSENIFSDHGRGIFLINQLMDEVRFQQNGTEIHMKKN